MRRTQSIARKGFTLVEILIVVIILGILAAIVIPQFTNASTEARQSSMTSQLQTIRSAVELYKLEHATDGYPTSDGSTAGAWDWTKLTGKTNPDHTGTTTGTPTKGPYLQQAPINPLNSSSDVQVVATDPAVGTAATGGFVFSTSTGKIFGVDANSKTTGD